MGFFSRTPSPNQNQVDVSAPKPYVLDDATMLRVPQLLDAFADAENNDLATRASVRAIAAAAGYTDITQAVQDISILVRPWQMLAACALRGAQDRDPMLSGKVFVFTWIWTTVIAPMAGVGDFMDMNLDPPSAAFQAEIAASAFEALETIPAREVIWKARSAPFTAGSARVLASIMMLNAEEKGAHLSEMARVAAATVVVDAAQRNPQLERGLVTKAERIVNENPRQRASPLSSQEPDTDPAPPEPAQVSDESRGSNPAPLVDTTEEHGIPRLYPGWYVDVLRETGKEVTDHNLRQLSTLAAGNMSVNAVRWFAALHDDPASERFYRQLETESPRQEVRCDWMIEFLWAWNPRVHLGLREFPEMMRATALSVLARHGDPLPDLWSSSK